MICPNIQSLNDVERDVCVIGAGPVGIPLALELSRRGKTVLLLASGGTGVRKDLQLLSEASIVDLNQHLPRISQCSDDWAVHLISGVAGAYR